MAGISGLLVTVRTGKQGAEMMRGKMNPEYLEEISTLRIHLMIWLSFYSIRAEDKD